MRAVTVSAELLDELAAVAHAAAEYAHDYAQHAAQGLEEENVTEGAAAVHRAAAVLDALAAVHLPAAGLAADAAGYVESVEDLTDPDPI